MQLVSFERSVLTQIIYYYKTVLMCELVCLLVCLFVLFVKPHLLLFSMCRADS